MAFTKPLPEWNNQGTEPPTSLKTSGWEANQKPPADYFNWLQYTAYQALQELQQKAADKNEITIQDGTTAQKGIIQLEDSTTSTSTTKAATPNAIKTVNDALTTHKNEDATNAHLAKNIGLQDADGLFTETNVEGALKELFINVDSGKTLVGDAIESKGSTVPTNPSFSDLATAVGRIETKKEYLPEVAKTQKVFLGRSPNGRLITSPDTWLSSQSTLQLHLLDPNTGVILQTINLNAGDYQLYLIGFNYNKSEFMTASDYNYAAASLYDTDTGTYKRAVVLGASEIRLAYGSMTANATNIYAKLSNGNIYSFTSTGILVKNVAVGSKEDSIFTDGSGVYNVGTINVEMFSNNLDRVGVMITTISMFE